MKKNKEFLIKISLILIYFLLIFGCKKSVQIPPPAFEIVASEVFKDSTNANSAVLGIYSSIGTSSALNYGTGLVTLDCGSAADELVNYVPRTQMVQYYTNTVTTSVAGQDLDAHVWSPAYFTIYQANVCIENVQISTGISQATKNQLLGEAKFLRAFVYFYLTGLFGDVPYITTSNYTISGKQARTPVSQIYDQSITDLLFAQKVLRDDYSLSNGERIRVNKGAATALLSRFYLYKKDWPDAITQASALINEPSLYSLEPDLNSVFLKNSSEAILQWNANISYQRNTTAEGVNLIPYDDNTRPYYYINQQLLNSFEPFDKRKIDWINSYTYSSDRKQYYYPYKYKAGPAQQASNTPATEYYMVLRLAEQYLIRAEASANSGDLGGAIKDLNTIRSRAGLPPLANSLNRSQVLSAVAQERKVELFAEWGHRWFDLKRTGAIDSVMSIVTPQKLPGSKWNSYQQLYPISLTQLSYNPNLKQNPGY